jgi:hypothetical protein
VYYSAGIVEDADASTFKALNDYGYASDAGHVYCSGEVLEGADPESFEALGRSYAQDNFYVYAGCETLEWADRETFRFIDLPFEGYLVDKDNVSYLNNFIEGADPESFEIVKEYYAKDDTNIYYNDAFRDSVVDGADYETFTELEDGFAYDKNTLFYRGKDLSTNYTYIE